MPSRFRTAQIPGWPVSTAIGHVGHARDRDVRRRSARRRRPRRRASLRGCTRAEAGRARTGCACSGRLGARGARSSRTLRRCAVEELRPGDLVLVSRHLNLQGSLAADRAERRRARASFPGHEQRRTTRRCDALAPRRAARSRPDALTKASTPPGSGRRSRRSARDPDDPRRSAAIWSGCRPCPRCWPPATWALRWLTISCVDEHGRAGSCPSRSTPSTCSRCGAQAEGRLTALLAEVLPAL